MAIYAGLDALNKGGNAMDACLATSMAQITLVAGAYVSYAGIANIVYYNNVTKTTVNINGEWNQLLNPLRNRSDLVKHGDPSPSGSGVLTPVIILLILLIIIIIVRNIIIIIINLIILFFIMICFFYFLLIYYYYYYLF